MLFITLSTSPMSSAQAVRCIDLEALDTAALLSATEQARETAPESHHQPHAAAKEASMRGVPSGHAAPVASKKKLKGASLMFGAGGVLPWPTGPEGENTAGEGVCHATAALRQKVRPRRSCDTTPPHGTCCFVCNTCTSRMSSPQALAMEHDAAAGARKAAAVLMLAGDVAEGVRVLADAGALSADAVSMAASRGGCLLAMPAHVCVHTVCVHTVWRMV